MEKTPAIDWRCLMHQILFAIPGLSDPVSTDNERQEGAILRLLQKRSFDKVILLGLPGYRLNAMLTERTVSARLPGGTVQLCPLNMPSFSYKAVFGGLKTILDASTSNLWEDDRLTFLLPSAANDPVLDCWLLSALSLPWKIEVFQAEPTTDGRVQQMLPAGEDAFEWNDSALDERENATFLSSQQLDFLYRTWDQNISFCLQTKDTEQQVAISRAMRLYSQLNGYPYREVACADIPESFSTELLWGYRAEVNGKNVSRDGLLTKKGENISLLQWEAFSESLKSDTVAFLSKSDRHFMVLSTAEDALLQVPTYALPNA